MKLRAITYTNSTQWTQKILNSRLRREEISRACQSREVNKEIATSIPYM